MQGKVFDFNYILPIGMSPEEIEKCKPELEYALGGTCDFETRGRVVTIRLFKGELPRKVKYERPLVNLNKLEVPIGFGVEGKLITLDMSNDSHAYLLVGGNPGTGKSVFLNGCIDCLSQYSPEYVRFITIDMKLGVELGEWEDLPHAWLHAYDPTKPELKHTLTMILAEIKRRMILFNEAGVKKLVNYNKVAENPLPYLMLIVDEYAELKNSDDGNDYEQLLKSILQIGRASGLRCIAATQRPTVDNISGTIKAVFTDRVAFAVSSKINSRVILDCDGAEKIPNHIPGRAIFLTGSKFQNVQVMNFEG